MHFDALFTLVVADYMLESGQIEIAANFAVDAREYILIERRRHTDRVVVCRFQYWKRLLQVGRQQQRIISAQNGAHIPEKLIAGRAIEVPDSAAEEKNQQSLPVAATRSHLLQSIEVGAFEAHQANHIHLPQFQLASKKCAA